MRRPSEFLRDVAPLTDRERMVVITLATLVLLGDILSFPQVARDSAGAKAAAASVVPSPAAQAAVLADPVTPAPALNYESKSVKVKDPFQDTLTMQPGSASSGPPPRSSADCGAVPGILPGDNVCVAAGTKVAPPPGGRGSQGTTVVELGHGSTNALLRIGSDQTVIVHVGSLVGSHRVKSIGLDTGVTLDDGAVIPAAAGDITVTSDVAPSPSPAPSASPSPSPGPETQEPSVQAPAQVAPTRATTPYQQLQRRSGLVVPNASPTQGSPQ